jgi:hypothetical protein
MKKLYKVVFMNGHRVAYTEARSIPEAVSRTEKVLRTDSTYTKEEAKICSVEVLAGETWPGVFGG